MGWWKTSLFLMRLSVDRTRRRVAESAWIILMKQTADEKGTQAWHLPVGSTARSIMMKGSLAILCWTLLAGSALAQSQPTTEEESEAQRFLLGAGIHDM
jgi:hypothetical protein